MRRVHTCGLLALAALWSPGCGFDEALSGNGNNNRTLCSVGLTYAPSRPTVGQTVEMTVEASDVLQAEWLIESPSGQALAPEIAANGTRAEFVPQDAGSYHVWVQITQADGSTCRDEAWITVRPPGANRAWYTFVFSIPPDRGPPIQSFREPVSSGTPETKDFVLSEGVPTNLTVVTPDGRPLAATIRILSRTGGPSWEVSYEADEPARVSLDEDDAYDVVVFPRSELYPAALFPQELPAPSDHVELTIPAGVLTTGRIVDGDGRPVVGARVLMTCSGLPSPGVETQVDGSFALAARPGSCQLDVIPPEPTWPRASLPAGTGLVISEDATAVDLLVELDAVPSATLDVTVHWPDGSPAAGAAVTLEATALGPVGTVRRQGAPLEMKGQFFKAAILDDAGHLSLPALPAGRYSLLVEPTDRRSMATYTLDLSQDATRFAETLPEPVIIEGTLTTATGDPLPQVRIEARLAAGTGSVFATESSQDGTFRLDLPPGFTYTFVFRPTNEAAAAMVARDLRIETSGPIPLGTEGLVSLPLPLEIQGTVDVPGGASGTLLRVFGEVPDVPLAETVLRPDGSYRILVPDPPMSE